MTQRKKLVVSVFAGLILSILISMTADFTAFAGECSDIRDEVVRIHILANSNTREDQELKIKIRDRILTECSDIFAPNGTKQDALNALSHYLPQIKLAAEEELERLGYAYPVNVSLEKTYFTTRFYENLTLPAGTYDALRVEIGKASGHNWWCIAFPQMCLPAAEQKTPPDQVFSEQQEDIMENSQKYEVKFAIVEFFESIGQKISKLFE